MPPSQPPRSNSAVSTRRIVAASATIMLTGIAVTAIQTGPDARDSALSIFGQVLTAAAFGALVWGLHRLGRLGPEPSPSPGPPLAPKNGDIDASA